MPVETSYQIRSAAADAIIEHAREDAPNECCGLLLGDASLIDEAIRARNLSASRTRYLVDPVDHFAAIRAARQRDVQVVGAYHSHPASPAVPSPTDLSEAFYPDFIYLIVSLAVMPSVPAIRAYRIEHGNFREIALVPVP